MSFDRKLEQQFNGLTIDLPSTPKYITHIYADYMELNALFLKEEVTIADISDKLSDMNDSNILETEDLDRIESELQEIASLVAEKQDIIKDRFNYIFDVCKERGDLYEENEYPFFIQDNYIKLKSDLTDKQKLYILLLLCSNLNYFRLITSELTKDFEVLSFYSLKSFLPSKAIVKEFGKNSSYVGNAKKKISTLAQELCVRVNSEKLNDIPETNSQERGLDLIAWLPFADNIPNMIIILAQCACGKEWHDKQVETKRFEGYMYFNSHPVHMMFIPYAISAPCEIKFHQSDVIVNGHIIFDRKRILEQLDNIDFLQQLSSFPAVEKSINEIIRV